jgi:flagellar biosynthesis protein FlhF
MKIMRFTGTSMADALARLKAALGPEAIILETAAAGCEVTVAAAVDETPVAAAVPSGELVGEVRQLLDVVRALVEGHWRRTMPGIAREVLPLRRALVAQGVDGVVAAALVGATTERLAGGIALGDALADLLERPAPPPRRVRLFVGPPGDGKTTTIAKLAARERQAGRRVTLITTDTWRVGAVAELETYGRVLGAPVVAAADPLELERALASAADADMVLVDTAGASPAEAPQLVELRAFATAAGRDAGRTLVASVTAGSRAAAQTWEAFAPVEPDACVLTKLDLGPAGPLLGIVWRGGLPVSHVASGRRIPDDLEPATPERLARCLLAA